MRYKLTSPTLISFHDLPAWPEMKSFVGAPIAVDAPLAIEAPGDKSSSGEEDEALDESSSAGNKR